MQTRLGGLIVALLAAIGVGTADAADPVTAFVGVTVIRAYGQPYLKDQTVVVRGDRIVAVTPRARAKLPTNAVILGHRGEIVAPGLTDMHAHIFERGDGVLYLANGVTTVRNMAGRPDTDAMRGRIQAGTEPGPYIYSSSPIIDGPGPEQRRAGSERTASDVRRLVSAYATAGYVGAKLYDNLSPEAFAAGVAAARDNHMQAYAHVPFAMSLEQVLDLHIDSIEHLTGFDRALAPQSTSDWDEQRWAEADAGLIAPLAKRVAASGVWNTATLMLLGSTRAFADVAAAQADPHYIYATPRERALWRRIYEAQRAERDPQLAWAMTQRAHQVRLKMVKALRAAGAPLLIGTDAPQPYVYPGFSLHEELALHREGGLAAADILRSDTGEAARFLNKSGEFGVVAPGARADLLLLDADPVADLKVLRTPAGVMAAGRWYDAATLTKMLAMLAAERAEPAAR